MCGDSWQYRGNKRTGQRPLTAQSTLSLCKCDCQVVGRISNADRRLKEQMASIDHKDCTDNGPSDIAQITPI